ncbi:MAG: pyruvate kinase, partial [Candidatus Zipacnadales bacterium]
MTHGGLMDNFNWTKIIATLGPATETDAALEGLIQSGVDVLRLNMSHGDPQWHVNMITRIRQLCTTLGKHVAVLMDLQGPRIRVGELVDGKVELVDGAECTITCEKIVGTADCFSTTYNLLAQDVKGQDRILLDDGLIELQVIETCGCLVRCRVKHGGTLLEHKGINLPGVKVSAPALSDKDLADVALGLSHGVDYIALSFVRSPKDVTQLRKVIQVKGYDTPIISKLEKPEALEHLDKIVAVSDAIMVARGDLAVETAPEEVPLWQRRIIASCAIAQKPVIVATQMLESMRENPTPTRAEASDVANAIFDGADAVMLSGETAVGRFPLESVRMMRRICLAAEKEVFRGEHLATAWQRGEEASFGEALSRAAAEVAEQIGATSLIAFTQSGQTARLASKCRPSVPIIAATPLPETARRCSLY